MTRFGVVLIAIGLLSAAPAQAAKPSQLVFQLRYGIGGVTFGAPAGERVIEKDTDTRIPRNPVLSPTGSEIAYGVYDPTHQKSFLTIRDQHDRIVKELPVSLRGGDSVAWSPNGRELAYTCADGPVYTTTDSFTGDQIPHSNVCVITIASGESRVIASSTAAAYLASDPDPRLSWAPDGTIIAGGRTPAAGYHELAGDAKGSGEPLRLFVAYEAKYAQFKPGGAGIVFQDAQGIGVADGDNVVKRVDAPGDGITPFAGPGWAPDGKSLVVSAKGDNGNLDLFEVPLGGGAPKQLTTATPGDDETFASWGPPASTCSVPKLKGKSLKKAKKLIKRAGCTLGKAKGRGKVAKQSPKAGREVDPGTKVDLKLG